MYKSVQKIILIIHPYLHPMPQTKGFVNMVFLCRPVYFIEFLAKIFGGNWPQPSGEGLKKLTSVQMCTFYVIPSWPPLSGVCRHDISPQICTCHAIPSKTPFGTGHHPCPNRSGESQTWLFCLYLDISFHFYKKMLFWKLTPSPTTTLHGVESQSIVFSVQAWTFHAIPSKTFWVFDLHHIELRLDLDISFIPSKRQFSF